MAIGADTADALPIIAIKLKMYSELMLTNRSTARNIVAIPTQDTVKSLNVATMNARVLFIMLGGYGTRAIG